MSEFEQLYQFLEDQEEFLLARLEQLQKEVIMEEKTTTSEISKLRDLVHDVEERCKQPVSEFFQVRRGGILPLGPWGY